MTKTGSTNNAMYMTGRSLSEMVLPYFQVVN